MLQEEECNCIIYNAFYVYMIFFQCISCFSNSICELSLHINFIILNFIIIFVPPKLKILYNIGKTISSLQ